VRKRFAQMRAVFPEAMITGYESLIDSMTCDPKDRHVLAAAIGNVDQLVTENGKDFPPASTEPFNIEVVTPDDLLLNSLDLYPQRVRKVIREQAADLKRPPMSVDDVLTTLAKHVPNFAQSVDTLLRAT
jgi:hypothetical protein